MYPLLFKRSGSRRFPLTPREAYIALNMMQGVGPVSVRTLSAALGGVERLFDADRDALMAVPGVGGDMVRKILDQRSSVDPAAEEERARCLGAHLVTAVDPEYPRRLLQIYDPPMALYVKGDLQTRDERGVAIVGSRRTTHYGREVAERLGFQLAQSGVTVNSGLARGIDTAAHGGALKGKGRTLAVLGGGLDCLFPPENAALADAIAKQGAVLTEYPIGRAPDKTTFPVRNRIVSGMSLGVVVVEADVTSGAMITARQAGEQGRTVFAVPGRVDSFGSRGPHQLLKAGARLVESVEDILEEMGELLPPGAGRARTASPETLRLTDDEKVLVDLLEAEGEMDVDTLIRRSGRNAGQVSALLLGLEMKRVVRMLPGQRVARRGQDRG
jgi:DNA processing protein